MIAVAFLVWFVEGLDVDAGAAVLKSVGVIARGGRGHL